ncbi:TPA: phage baseplate protein [Citrobacter braakii]
MEYVSDGAVSAPRDNRAVMVFESGVTVSLRLKMREGMSVKRTVAKGKLETGYKIADGKVDDPKTVFFEGIITGTDLPYAPFHMIYAMNEAQQITAAYERDEYVSVYTSFMVMPQSVITSLSIEAEPKRNCYTVKLTAQKVDTVTFKRSRSVKSKTSSTAGKGKSSAGKKSATPVDTKKEPQKVYALEKMRRMGGSIL